MARINTILGDHFPAEITDSRIDCECGAVFVDGDTRPGKVDEWADHVAEALRVKPAPRDEASVSRPWRGYGEGPQ